MRVALTTVPRTYDELLRGVQDVLHTGRRDIEIAWVRTYHEIGRMINEHLLHFAARADYGTKLFARLAAESGVSNRSLRECAQFQRCFPIVRNSAKLGLSHYVLLCQVSDAKQRDALTKQVDSLVHDAKSVTVFTSKPDKYDRYLADVFIVTADGTDVFLNNHLLENGFAERKDAWDFGDWEKLAAR